jgi:hypothetical protein
MRVSSAPHKCLSNLRASDVPRMRCLQNAPYHEHIRLVRSLKASQSLRNGDVFTAGSHTTVLTAAARESASMGYTWVDANFAPKNVNMGISSHIASNVPLIKPAYMVVSSTNAQSANPPRGSVCVKRTPRLWGVWTQPNLSARREKAPLL